MHPLTRVRDHRLQALSIPAIGAALLVLPGCLALYEYEPVTVTVIDAESNAPIRGAQVELSYPHVMCLNPPRDIACETGSDGRVEIEVATFDVKWWRVSSPGYITDDSDHITDRPGDGRVGSPGHPHEFRLYREPEPEIVVVIPTGYVGPVLIDFIPSKTWIQDARDPDDSVSSRRPTAMSRSSPVRSFTALGGESLASSIAMEGGSRTRGT